MRIERLKINDFRGIPELVIEPEGDNLCLVGPNGSGKSSVIEAVDFLLTGEVKDLKGEGAGDLSIREHAPYLMGDFEEAEVEATLSLNGDSVTIRRSLGDRNTLDVEGGSSEDVERYLTTAEKGLHYLSRREILNFIVSRKQSRSEEIRSLLDLDTIKRKRLELQGAADNLDEEASQVERELSSSRARLIGVFEDVEEVTQIREAVNEIREELQGEALEELSVETRFRTELDSPADRASANPLQSTRTQELLTTIDSWFEQDASRFLDDYQDLQQSVDEVRDKEEALRDLESYDLIRLGKGFVDETTRECPLCLTDWDPEELMDLLERRVEQAAEAEELRNEIDGKRSSLLSSLTNVRTAVQSLVDILGQHDEFNLGELDSFRKGLQEVDDGLSGDLITEIPLEDLDEDERGELLAPGEVGETVGNLRDQAEEAPDLDEVEGYWDVLGSAYEEYVNFVELKETTSVLREAADEMEAVKNEFLDARDDVLMETYDAISERFEELYMSLHRDEEEFTPRIEPTETGLDLQVDFYGEGLHPPHALHSEGHQDSMGLCLFLALCDYLDGDELALVMLDDVVMSIDANHRRPLAELLAGDVSEDHQLFITTHDELWYRHLKAEGVVSSSNTVKFTSWNLEDGPIRVDQLADGWERIEEFLDEGDVPGAAHRLRHTAEWFFREACHQLRAEVRFDAEGRWMLGDFMSSALSKFKKSIKKAKSAEQSWGNDISDINALDDRRSEVYGRLGMEDDQVNPNVHYTEDEWATFRPSEMREVVDAFRDLYGLFWCDNCGACVRVLEEEHKEVMLRCKCGQKAQWNLVEKS